MLNNKYTRSIKDSIFFKPKNVLVASPNEKYKVC